MKAKPYYWLVRKDQPFVSAGSMMEMLRYDGALVLADVPAGHSGYWLLRSEHTPAEARWNSFGIHIVGPEREVYTLRERIKL